ncbi:MAG: BrnT family toxin [Rhodospirillales bacterium]
MKDSWDENKRRSNMEKHPGGHDFALLENEFDWAGMERFSGNLGAGGEVRWKAVGLFRGRIRTVIYTVRDGGRRYISFRPARENERRDYYEHKKGISQAPHLGGVE